MILAKGTITVLGEGTDAAARTTHRNNKKVVFKNHAPFTDFSSEINHAQEDKVKDLDIVIPMYTLIEYSDNYAKTRSLWQYCRDEPGDDITDSESCKCKSRFANNTGNVGTVNVEEVAVSLIYSSNLWRGTDVLSANCLICEEDLVTIFSISDAKLFVPLVTL